MIVDVEVGNTIISTIRSSPVHSVKGTSAVAVADSSPLYTINLDEHGNLSVRVGYGTGWSGGDPAGRRGSGVSQRFASPTGEVIPGLKMLLVSDADPVMLFVMSVILMIHGEEHDTLGFHEPEPTGNWGVLTTLGVDPLV